MSGSDSFARVDAAIRFPGWSAVLASAPLSAALKESHRRAILGFLQHCKVSRTPASVTVIRAYLQKQGSGPREGLRWFYRMAVDPPGGVAGPDAPLGGSGPPSVRARHDIPPLAAGDLGGADWERDLIAAVRARGFLWRTEETYRMWAARFAKFLAPRTPYAATAEDVGGFLSRLAIEQRAMPSTQKQALNALVFLQQEALHRQLGAIDFRRATPRARTPTVLSREECGRLFAELKGTLGLMAELMYGSGLRLLELLRLRVHHLDFARGQLKIAGAKGDRVEAGAHAA